MIKLKKRPNVEYFFIYISCFMFTAFIYCFFCQKNIKILHLSALTKCCLHPKYKFLILSMCV